MDQQSDKRKVGWNLCVRSSGVFEQHTLPGTSAHFGNFKELWQFDITATTVITTTTTTTTW
jgi:hypothetical protein